MTKSIGVCEPKPYFTVLNKKQISISKIVWKDANLNKI